MLSLGQYEKPQQQLVVTRSNKLIHQWFIVVCKSYHSHVSAASIRSLVIVLIFSEVKAAFFTLQCRCDVYNFEQSKYNTGL